MLVSEIQCPMAACFASPSLSVVDFTFHDLYGLSHQSRGNRGGRTPLDWTTRLKIGSVRGTWASLHNITVNSSIILISLSFVTSYVCIH
ncbi:hypothetical protein CUMW_277140 [Citrus unshiu]|uniref:Uncharacterized protein n=1 Tax=Citrus unshiu TaxID=55188 RepID=A0A2H5N3W3_CITUN|nr:hypothetical protein CUMW_277140 [Citrus unshiu]